LVRLDDEGDEAIFCAGDKTLLGAVRADYQRLNADPKSLDAVLGQIPTPELE